MDASRREFLKRSALAGVIGAACLRNDALAEIQSAAASTAERSPEQMAGDEDFWFQIQHAFTVDRTIINLNNGGVSPSPRIVQEALRRHYEYANEAPSRHLWNVQDPQVETVRERLAETFGCGTDEMAITRNASESLEICIYGMDLKAGDEVVACELDYPRMLNTYRQREVREGIKLNLVPIKTPIQHGQEVVEAYRQAITPRTKVMLCSHVVFVTGQIMPVRELCRLGRAHGIPVVVDGAHAFAHMAFQRDDLECEFYGTSLHKWLTAAHGTGFLYVHKDRIADLWPLMAAVKPQSDSIRKFEEIGTHPAANRMSIAEALLIYDAIGPQRKEARMRYLRDRWARRIADNPRVSFAARLEPPHTCGFVTFAIDGVEPQELAQHLWAAHRIVVVPIEYGNVKGVRVSPNTYTSIDEIDLFSRAIEAVIANGIPA